MSALSHLLRRLNPALILLISTPSFAEAETPPPEPTSKPVSTNGVKTVTLDEVIAEGTPAEALKFDPIVSAFQGETKAKTSTGNIAKELQNDLPFHFNTNLKPGAQVGFLGTGKGSEETDVNVLGIPVNGAQGGGADLSTFPQYFWSGYSYQIGPSLGAYDPRGVSGSLTLRLWTQEMVGTESKRWTALHSTRHLQQFSYAQSSKKYAFNLGVTGSINGVHGLKNVFNEIDKDDFIGPAFTLSAIPYEDGDTRVTSHLIFADNRVAGFQSERSGSLTAIQETLRIVPVLQLDQRIPNSAGIKANFKGSLFHDFTLLHNEDPPTSSKYIAHVHQLGFESVTTLNDTRIGLSLRNVAYDRSNFVKLPQEQVANLQLTQTFHKPTSDGGEFTIEPTVAGNIVTRKGFFPITTFGVRHSTPFVLDYGSEGQYQGEFGQFIRAGFHHRFPSLLDRYYSQSFAAGPGTTLVVIPNPGLQPENIRSVEMGVDYKAGNLKTQLTGFYRDYKHARYTKTTMVDPPPAPTVINFQITNEGNAYTFGAIHTLDWTILPTLDLGTRVNFQRSNIYQLRLPFPYSPEWVGVLKADLHDPLNRMGIDGAFKVATSYQAFSETSGNPVTLSHYYYLDLTGRIKVSENTVLSLAVENVFDEKIAFRSGFPDLGRVYTLSAMGNF